MSETLPHGLDELARELEQTWPDHLAQLRASGLPLMEGGDPAADVGDPDPGPDPAPDLSAGDPAPDPAPAPVDWNAPEVQARLEQERQQTIAAVLANFQPQPGPQEFQLDPFSDQFGDQLVQAFGHLLDQRLGGIEGFVQNQSAAQVDQQIDQHVLQAVSEAKLENAPSSAVIAKLAENFTADAVRKYGSQTDSQRLAAAQAAIRQAVDFIASERRTASEAAVRAYRVQIGEIADTPAEPSSTGGALRIEQKPKTYDDIIAQHAARERVAA